MPAFSPDGRQIAFVRSLGSIVQELFVAPASGEGEPRQLTFDKTWIDGVAWSRDGKRIVFASSRTANYEIWISDADGSNARQLTDLQNSPAGSSPRFSPDDRFVVFDAQIAGNSDIFVVPTEGGAMRRLTDAGSLDFMPSWSRDGQWIYFASDCGGKAQIWKMPAAGGEPVQITKQGGRESYESPDGAELYYSKGEGVNGLWRVPVNGGEESPVAELSEAGYWRYWTVMPKGVYYVARGTSAPYQIKFYDFQNRQTTEIAMMENPPIWVFPGLSVSPDGKTILYAQHDLNASSIMLAEIAETKN